MKCFLSLLILTANLVACANPQSAVESDTERFKKEHSNQIVSFSEGSHTLNYAWSGDKAEKPIIFVHGSPGSWDGWAEFLMNADLQKKYQLIAVDRPGFGGSENGNTERSLAEQAKEIIGVLRFNQSKEKAILVGHSFGGPVIARMAMDYPDKIDGLIFVAASVSPDLEKTKWFQYPAEWWPIRLLIPNSLRVCNEEIFALKDELIKMLPLWSSIQARSVLIQGDADELVPPANLDFLTAHLPPSRVLKVMKLQGLNHFIPWKRPDLILEAIRAL